MRRNTLARAMQAALTAWLASRRDKRNASILVRMSDADLKDMGLTRSDLRRIVNEGSRRR